MTKTGQKKYLWMALFLLAVGIRATVLIVDLSSSHHLNEDRDAYLDISHQLATGQGYSLSETGKPTAFRPPLYPLILAGIERTGTGVYGIAFLHFLLSSLTVYFTFHIARKLLPENESLVAMAFIAVDPLLIQYTTLVMTETLFIFLFTLLINQFDTEPVEEDDQKTNQTLRSFGTGLLFGLCALCRPTVWAFGILCLISLTFRFFKQKKSGNPVSVVSWSFVLGLVLIVSPWTIRNQIQFKKPIFTTTHGGYTLLLGNNSVFYYEVVSRSWGTVWSYDSLKRWQSSLEKEMKIPPAQVASETERDRWMYQKAFEEIRKQPKVFLSACWLRFRRFWNIVPTGEAANGISGWIRLGIGLYYLTLLVGMIIGIFRLKRSEWNQWLPIILSIVALTGVHLFYWTNMRMRAPILPLICILAMRGFKRNRWNSEE